MNNWSYDDGANVMQWGSGAQENEQWFFEYAGDGYFYLPLDLWPPNTERVELQKPWVIVS